MGYRGSAPRDTVTWEYAGWKVLNWRLHENHVWAFSLLQPNGSRYEYQPIIGTIEKRPFEDFYTVEAGTADKAKGEVKNMIEALIRIKGPGVQDTVYYGPKPGRPGKRSAVPKFDVSPEYDDRYSGLPSRDTSWVQMETIKNDYGRLARKEKSLWQEWREKRAAKKAAKSTPVDAEPKD